MSSWYRWEGGGRPFLSHDEGPLAPRPPGSFPVRAAQQRVPDLLPKLYEFISVVFKQREETSGKK